MAGGQRTRIDDMEAVLRAVRRRLVRERKDLISDNTLRPHRDTRGAREAMSPRARAALRSMDRIIADIDGALEG